MKPVAIAELKGWWSSRGEREIPGIQSDIRELPMLKVPGVMLILTHHAKQQADENLKFLAEKLGVKADDFRTKAFDAQCVKSGDDSPDEFMVIGIGLNLSLLTGHHDLADLQG